ncbi:MAG: preprotein translocase subunit SecE [Gemmatimonadota bacterium]|nr:MAG: preprotein translocase subunit SecE [Gemmatimonadota bacterium]
MSLGLMIGSAVGGLAAVALIIWRQPVFAFAVRTATYMHNVRAEMRKVSWPTWDDLRKSTVVIVIIVFIIGAIIGLMDLIFSKLLIDWLGRAF